MTYHESILNTNNNIQTRESFLEGLIPTLHVMP
jgi:hypothetical protein